MKLTFHPRARKKPISLDNVANIVLDTGHGSTRYFHGLPKARLVLDVTSESILVHLHDDDKPELGALTIELDRDVLINMVLTAAECQFAIDARKDQSRRE